MNGSLAVGLGQPRVRMTEPTPEEQHRFHAWLERHRADLGRAWSVAEDLSRAYDRAAIVTKDGNPEIPGELGDDIDHFSARWETVRWTGPLLDQP